MTISLADLLRERVTVKRYEDRHSQMNERTFTSPKITSSEGVSEQSRVESCATALSRETARGTLRENHQDVAVAQH